MTYSNVENCTFPRVYGNKRACFRFKREEQSRPVWVVGQSLNNALRVASVSELHVITAVASQRERKKRSLGPLDIVHEECPQARHQGQFTLGRYIHAHKPAAFLSTVVGSQVTGCRDRADVAEWSELEHLAAEVAKVRCEVSGAPAAGDSVARGACVQSFQLLHHSRSGDF